MCPTGQGHVSAGPGVGGEMVIPGWAGENGTRTVPTPFFLRFSFQTDFQ